MIHSPYQQNSSEDTCYICKTIGHLTHNCPKTNPSPVQNQASSSTPQMLLGFNGETEARILCKCGTAAKPETVKSEKNLGKRYFKCMGNCGFVKWVHEVKPEKIIWVPKCKCMAEFCRLSVENSGPNAGRTSFICPIKKGQGKCSFQQWVDEAEVTKPINGVKADERINSFALSTPTNTGGDNISPASNNILLHQDPHTDPHGPQDQGSVSGLSKRTRTTTTMIVDEFEGEADISTGEESLRKKRLDPKFLNFDTSDWFEDASADTLQKEDLHAPMAPMSNAEVTYKQLEFTGLVSNGSCSSSSTSNSVLSREDCLLTTAMLNDHSSKELVEQYNREKKCLDDVSRDLAKAMADLEACKGRIELLFQIETELLCRRAENQVLESEYAKVSTEAVDGALKRFLLHVKPCCSFIFMWSLVLVALFICSCISFSQPTITL